MHNIYSKPRTQNFGFGFLLPVLFGSPLLYLFLKFFVAHPGTQLPRSGCSSRFLAVCGYRAPSSQDQGARADFWQPVGTQHQAPKIRVPKQISGSLWVLGTKLPRTGCPSRFLAACGYQAPSSQEQGSQADFWQSVGTGHQAPKILVLEQISGSLWVPGTKLPRSGCLSRFLAACGYWQPSSQDQGARADFWQIVGTGHPLNHIQLRCLLSMTCK